MDNELWRNLFFINNDQDFFCIYFVKNKQVDKLAGIVFPNDKKKFHFIKVQQHSTHYVRLSSGIIHLRFLWTVWPWFISLSCTIIIRYIVVFKLVFQCLLCYLNSQISQHANSKYFWTNYTDPGCCRALFVHVSKKFPPLIRVTILAVNLSILFLGQ